MPYIAKPLRKKVDPAILSLIETLKDFSPDEIEGVLNYSFSRILSSTLENQEGMWRYKWINRAIGVLECIKLEFYRRLAAPYEDIAMKKNSDINEYRSKKNRKK